MYYLGRLNDFENVPWKNDFKVVSFNGFYTCIPQIVSLE